MHNDNKLIVALGIFSILLLICLFVVLIHKNPNYIHSPNPEKIPPKTSSNTVAKSFK